MDNVKHLEHDIGLRVFAAEVETNGAFEKTALKIQEIKAL
ncbi:MAG: hypothetical protein ACI88A_003381 [Paraglaciecola sp.]